MTKTARSRWYLYDELLDTVPAETLVRRFIRGNDWLMLESDRGGIGMAHNFPIIPGAEVDMKRRDDILGQPLRKIAERMKSWDFNEACMGLAALNASINTSPKGEDGDKKDRGDAFDFFLPETKGRKVTVIGHFPYLGRLEEQCELSILERMPQPGDLPDSAAEYILPEQDFVYITGTTFVNKTITRLLELTPQAVVCLVGPSTPMHPLLFKHGVTSLSGLMVSDYAGMADVLRGDSCERIFATYGVKVNLVDKAGK